ncbi:MAG TPA: hypothetical protein VEB63_04600 [Chitinophagaceae bacterium]|nr:hypothetical protein [Chitinophagaceae bacterium]
MQRSRGLGLLLAAAAAYGYFRYRKMSPEQRRSLQQRGRTFIDRHLGNLKNVFGKRQTHVSNISDVSRPQPVSSSGY